MSHWYLINRLLLALPTLLGAVTITFVLLRVVPGDPIAMMTGPGATEADIAQLRAHYGLDQSIVDQFSQCRIIKALFDIFDHDCQGVHIRSWTYTWISSMRQ